MTDKTKGRIKDLIQRYFDQFTAGCGHPGCENVSCASCPDFIYRENTRDELAAKALLAVKTNVKICSQANSSQLLASEEDVNCCPMATASSSSSEEVELFLKIISEGLCAKKVTSVIDHCKKSGNFKLLVQLLNRAFSDPELLRKSFRISEHEDNHSMLNVLEKHEQECDEKLKGIFPKVGYSLSLEDVAKTFRMIDALQNPEIRHVMAQSFNQCLDQIQLLIESSAFLDNCDIENVFIVLLRCPIVQQIDTLPAFHVQLGELLEHMPTKFQAQLCKILSQFESSWLRHHVLQIQTCITDIVMTDGQMRRAPKSKNLLGLLRLGKLFYYACLLCSLRRETSDSSIVFGDDFSPEQIINDPNSSELLRYAFRQHSAGNFGMHRDQLAEELGICNRFPHDLPIMPSDFVNGLLNEVMELEREHGDFFRLLEMTRHSPGYMNPSSSSAAPDFSFFHYPYILDTHQKYNAVFYDNIIKQRQEMRESYLRSIFQQPDFFRNMPFSPLGNRPSPHLRFVVSRDRIVEETLMQLEFAALDNLSNLKKRLYIVFDGEPGVDEGGVQKEFFQLIVERVLSPDYGMFVYDPETKFYWFNPISHDYNEFFLIGFIFGLAIYNSCILNLSFPSVLFRKLLGLRGSFVDLKQSHPTIGRSLQQLLEYPGDVEADFMLTFQISFTDVFGNIHTIKLKEGGDAIPVTKLNRQEFVELYADTILNRLVTAQFSAFQLGWHLVTSSSVLRWLVRPDELELFVCGQPNIDLDGLRESTKYDGYEQDSPTVQHFWTIFNTFSAEQRRQFLMFVTGSDRVPIGGAAALRFIVAKASADSDHLPSAHTCFNLLLLPDYNNLEKLREKLLIAIEYNLGFGLM